MGLMLNANCCVGVSNPFAMYGSVLFQTNTPLHNSFVGVWDNQKLRPSILKWFAVKGLKNPFQQASMGFDEGQKMRVGFVCLLVLSHCPFVAFEEGGERLGIPNLVCSSK